MDKKADSRIKDFLKKVKKNYKIDKAIFFGSRATGNNLKYSDYDIILVSPDFKGIFFTKRIALMYDFWEHYPLEIEPLCYTPEEFKKLSKQATIVREAVKTGVEI